MVRKYKAKEVIQIKYIEHLEYHIDLQACPNCKSPTVLKYIEFEDGEVWYNPQCEKCELMFKHNFKTKEESVIAWNENTKCKCISLLEQ